MTTVSATAAPLTEHIERAVENLVGRRTAVLTGAGVSTDSGIPDYRGEGAPKSHPMTFKDFMGSVQHRQRYWLGSHLGWASFSAAIPNLGHRSIVRAEASSIVSGVITQNVDALHHKAGSLRVVDLHGRLDNVNCISCYQSYSRNSITKRIEELNPWMDSTVVEGAQKPDGDFDVKISQEFAIPDCEACGGILKPSVIFYGEMVPSSIFARAANLIASSEALIVVGSSLVVNTGMRLVGLANKNKFPIVIINRGITKADPIATTKIDGGSSESLDLIVTALLGK